MEIDFRTTIELVNTALAASEEKSWEAVASLQFRGNAELLEACRPKE